MTLPRLYYKLPELAEKWNKTQEDLLQMAAAGAMELSTKHFGSVFTRDDSMTELEIRDYVQLYPDVSERILKYGIKNGYKTSCARWRGVDVIAHKELGPVDGLPIYPFMIESNSDLLILPDEVARVEKLYPELTGADISMMTNHHDNSSEDYVCGNAEIGKQSGMSWNTFKKYAELAQIEIEKTEGSNPKSKMTKANIRKVVKFRKEY